MKIKHLIQQNQFNLSVAPLPSIFSKSNLSTNITKSNVKESDIHTQNLFIDSATSLVNSGAALSAAS